MPSFHRVELWVLPPPQTMALQAVLSGVEAAPVTDSASVYPLCSSSHFPERKDSQSNRAAAKGRPFILAYLREPSGAAAGKYSHWLFHCLHLMRKWDLWGSTEILRKIYSASQTEVGPSWATLSTAKLWKLLGVTHKDQSRQFPQQRHGPQL